MATCIETIQAGGIAELYPNTTMPLDFGPLKNQVYMFRSTQPQQGRFNLVFTPKQPTSMVNITVTAFQLVGTNVVDLGGVAFNDLVGTFSKDFTVGTFYLCFRSNQSYGGSVTGRFAGFVPEARFEGDIYTGESMSAELSIKRKPQDCDEPLFYKMIEGQLPPGLFMNSLGQIQGQLPNLDCLPDAHEYSPGFNLSYMDSSGTSHPWGRQWRFKVRVSMEGTTEAAGASAEDWFCLRVHNNWNFDRDNFLAQAPFANTRMIEVVEEVKPLEPVCYEPCDLVKETVFEPEEIDPPCPACDESDMVTDIQLIPIPVACQKIPVSALPVWWLQNEGEDFECPETKKFVESLRDSAYFQGLLAQAGYGVVPEDERTLFEISAFKQFVQISASSLVDGRSEDDIDALMIKWKHEQNQRLPVTAEGRNGEKLEVTLWTR